MAMKTGVARGMPALKHPHEAIELPQPPGAPRWMSWVPQAAVAWALAYGIARLWWVVGGPPSVPPQQDSDLIAFTGWGAVALCAAAAVIALALRTAQWRPWLFLAASTVSAGLIAAGAFVLLDIVGVLFPGQGVQVHAVAFVSRATAVTEGVLMGAAAVAYRRRWLSACLFCGWTQSSRRPAEPPRWARGAAYVAIGGCLVRLAAQVAIGFDEFEGGGWSVVGFEAGFLLAGTLLPLGLVHAWGRVVPRWIPLLAGRRVPRWLLLGPGAAIGGLMTVYFGFTLAKIAIETVTGTWEAGSDDLPLAFFWVAVPAFLVWGLGLGAAAIGYHQVTRPRCGTCGR